MRANDRIIRAFAGGVLLAALSGPVAADECGELRVALALEVAAGRAVSDLVEREKKAGNLDWWKSPEYEALTSAKHEAIDRAEEAAIGVRATITDEATAAMIDALNSARREVEIAERKASEWFSAPHKRAVEAIDAESGRQPINVSRVLEALQVAEVRQRPVEVLRSTWAARRAANRAYRDAVRAACDAP